MGKLLQIYIEMRFGSTNTYGPSVQIGDDKCAQLMFVVGTDGGGLSHPNWRENFKFALKMQTKANELYPRIIQTNNFEGLQV